MLKRWRETALAVALLGPLFFILLALPPIPQDPAYHAFADTNTAFGVPNFLNVASNLAFIAVGIVGFAYCQRNKPAVAATSWMVVFAGTALVGFGSGYYHWNPDSDSLVWDRLPITIAFMALFVALLSEHVSERLERIALPIAILVGVGSVAWWVYRDDLRLYGWVQFAPLVAAGLMLALFPARYSQRAYLGYALAFYILGKLAEAGDERIFALTHHAVSGHALKHLLAALAPFTLYRMLRARGVAPPTSVTRAVAPARS